MVKLLIPTRNRPTGLGGVLQFLRKHYPKTKVIIADGSSDAVKPLNQDAVAGAPGLSVDYRPYSYDLPFFDRLLDVLRSETDPYVIMGSDDDFPMMDMLERGETFLRANPDFVTAMGSTIHLTLRAPGDLVARLATVRPIVAESVEARARAYSAWAFSTTYAVTRREHLIARYERAALRFIPGFYDFATGLHDVMAGKIRAFPEIGFFGTRNYSHSYLRPEEPLIFLRRNEEVLTLMGLLRDDLMSFGGLDAALAKSTVEMMIARRIAELCGVPAHRRVGFLESKMFQNPTVKTQIDLFGELFAEGTAGRGKYLARLTDLVAALQTNAASADNAGEKRFYETLEAQTANDGGTDAAPVLKSARRQAASEGDGDNQELVQLRAINPENLLELFEGDDPDAGAPAPAVASRPMTPVSPGQLAPHILVIGQSNVANHGKPRSASDFGSYTVNGELAQLADPLQGGSGNFGSVWTRFAPLVRDRLGWDDLTVTLLAQSGSGIADWSEQSGKCHDILITGLEGVKAAVRPVTHIVFHQGEADNLRGTTKPQYMTRFTRLHALVSKVLPNAEWIVCRASYRMGVVAPAIIEAQTELAETLPRCHAGPDTDQFGLQYRHDNTHFADNGLAAFAEALCETFGKIGVSKPK